MLGSLALAADTSISGRVKDPDGAVFENLTVIITNVATHKKSEARTTKDGVFGPIPFPPGVYKVEIHIDCFKRYSRTVTLSDVEPSRLDISLVRTCRQPAVVE
jgi:hypothetical protein